jgi:hypothetical protein
VHPLKRILTKGGAWLTHLATHQDVREEEHQTVLKLLACGTRVMGYAKWQCSTPGCHHSKVIGFRCHNRACPSCGKRAVTEWINQLASTLPAVTWQHLTFTLPDTLRPLVRANRTLMSVFSSLASELFLKAGSKKSLLPALFIVQHTHGRSLDWHPHLHIGVTTGGWSISQQEWLPIEWLWHPLMKQWRYAVVTWLRQHQHELVMPEEWEGMPKAQWGRMLDGLYRKDWYLHACKPEKRPHRIARYLGGYVKKPVINMSQLTLQGDAVLLSYRDHRTHRKQTRRWDNLDAFICDWRQHIAPHHHKLIIHYGLLSPYHRHHTLPSVLAVTGASDTPKTKPTHASMLKTWLGIDPHQCILCQGRLKLSELVRGISKLRLLEQAERLVRLRPIGGLI